MSLLLCMLQLGCCWLPPGCPAQAYLIPVVQDEPAVLHMLAQLYRPVVADIQHCIKPGGNLCQTDCSAASWQDDVSLIMELSLQK